MREYQVKFNTLFKELSKVIIGQNEMMEQILIALLCEANVLLEGYPGLAKTLAVKTLSELMELKFSRVQHTPDLMPSDITGTYIVQEHGGKRDFIFQPGPIFANIVLADEINRSTPKTQSALLEAMQEKQVTVGNKTFPLDLPFFVLATQNPIEQEGTYPLPEAQADRFLLKVNVVYPTMKEELDIVEKYGEGEPKVKLTPVLTKKTLLALQNLAKEMPIANDLKRMAVKLVFMSRERKDIIQYGASPRASIGLIRAAKARALVRGRNHVSADDIQTMALPVLRHRIILNFESERKGLTTDDAIRELLNKL